MFARLRNLHPLSLITLGAVATLVLSGTAVAVTDTSFTYTTTQTGYLTIHPMDLAPADSGAVGDYSVSFDHARLSTALRGCYSTGIHLPHRARITSVETYFTSFSDQSWIWTVRNNLSTDTTEDLASPPVPDSGGVRASVTSTVPSALRTVWNNVYSYGYGICLEENDTFEGARITYTYTNAGD